MQRLSTNISIVFEAVPVPDKAQVANGFSKRGRALTDQNTKIY
jgi:hypothetical protein